MSRRNLESRLGRIELALAGTGAATADDREFHEAFGAFWDDIHDKAKGDRAMAALGRLHGPEKHARFLNDLNILYGDESRQRQGGGVQ